MINKTDARILIEEIFKYYANNSIISFVYEGYDYGKFDYISKLISYLQEKGLVEEEDYKAMTEELQETISYQSEEILTLEEEKESLQQEIERLREESKWINVNDKLPEEGI